MTPWDQTLAMRHSGAIESYSPVTLLIGVLSMGRYDDPNSGTSSFSMLLGSAPHLDMTYTIFGLVPPLIPLSFPFLSSFPTLFFSLLQEGDQGNGCPP